MAFTLITAATLIGVLFQRTHFRYAQAGKAAGTAPAVPGATRPTYGRWLAGRLRALASGDAWKKIWKALVAWAAAHYPGWTTWIFAAFGASLVYLAASGLFFAVFIPRGMTGVVLLGHMAFGGLFAAALAALLLWRARAYAPGRTGSGTTFGLACPVFKNVSREALRAALFWAIAVFGFVLIVSALGSMLPVFVFGAQATFTAIHRYAALALVLCAIVFADVAFVPPPRA